LGKLDRGSICPLASKYAQVLRGSLWSSGGALSFQDPWGRLHLDERKVLQQLPLQRVWVLVMWYAVIGHKIKEPACSVVWYSRTLTISEHFLRWFWLVAGDVNINCPRHLQSNWRYGKYGAFHSCKQLFLLLLYVVAHWLTFGVNF